MLEDIFFWGGRFIFGGYFAFMGLNHFMKTDMLTGYASSKGVPNPRVAVYGSGAMIFLGGLGVIFGFLVSIALCLIMLFLIGVSYKMHAFWKITEPGERMTEMNNFMKNMALLGASGLIASSSYISSSY
jgi:putative oxidoreductase